MNRLQNSEARQPHRVLLVEASDMPKWVGGGVGTEMHVLPIGLMYVAAATRKADPAAEIHIVQSSLDCPTDAAFLQLLDRYNPTVVGIRGIVFFIEEVRRLARLVRAHSDAAVVVGGPVVQAWKTRLFDEVAEVDVAVKGDGEPVFARLLHARDLAGVKGILYRDGARVVENPDHPETPDLDSLPLPAYDLVDLDRYRGQLSYAYNHRRQGLLVTSRGCVYSCSFCFRPWERLRLRSAASVLDEIRFLRDAYHIRDFYVVDDIFNVSLKRALAIFDGLIADGRDLRLYFVNGLRADIVTEEFVDRAIAAGAIWFTYAVESAAEEIQALTRKHLDLEKARRIIAYTQRQDVVVNISTMYGFPGETLEQARQTLDWLGELPEASVLPYHFCLRFFPGCDIREQALAAGFPLEQLEASSSSCYHDMPGGTPTLSRGDMTRVLLEYHRRFGLSNPGRVRRAVDRLRKVGYSEEEILHLYSVLRRKPTASVGELLAS